MSNHNICFYGELTKIILQLSSNTLLICSSVGSSKCFFPKTFFYYFILTMYTDLPEKHQQGRRWQNVSQQLRGPASRYQRT